MSVRSSRSARGTTPPTLTRDTATDYVLDVVQRNAGDVDALATILRGLELRDWPVDARVAMFAAVLQHAPAAARDAIAELAAGASAAAARARDQAAQAQHRANDRLDRWMEVGLQLRERDGDRFARVRELVEQLVASPATEAR